ncbi:hypothetical protein [Spartinivicinus ruber]|uniref:hypothetical protein n=1 Tax=Spartinivicinus ruber TaxID=2683272 RepID=UPI0013D88E40|nr:hypothetical protein [Spartinivicinus ruber]
MNNGKLHIDKERLMKSFTDGLIFVGILGISKLINKILNNQFIVLEFIIEIIVFLFVFTIISYLVLSINSKTEAKPELSKPMSWVASPFIWVGVPTLIICIYIIVN